MAPGLDLFKPRSLTEQQILESIWTSADPMQAKTLIWIPDHEWVPVLEVMSLPSIHTHRIHIYITIQKFGVTQTIVFSMKTYFYLSNELQNEYKI